MRNVPILTTMLALAVGASCSAQPAQQAQIENAVQLPAAELMHGDARTLSSDFRAATHSVLPAVARIDVVSRRASAVEGAPRLGQNPFQIPFGFPDAPEQNSPVQMGTGSGFVYDASGLVMTNRHVVDGADRVTVHLSDGREFDASVVGADANTDVAVLRLDLPAGTKLSVAALGDGDDVAVGDWVLAVGSPLGLDFSVTAGIVSAKGRSIGILARDGDAPIEAFIQTDAAINPGNSGGPLVDLDGRVVGINTAIQSPTGVFAGYGFAVPIDLARKVARDLERYGEVRRPRLGVQVANVTAADVRVFDLPSTAGAVARAVQAGTAAERAGMHMGDVMVALDGQPVRDASDLMTTLAEREPGDELTVGVIRYGKRLDLHVKLEQFARSESRRADSGAAATDENLLGFDTQEITPQLARQMNLGAETGLVVTDLEPLSPAAAAGVRPGQVLKSINGKDLTSVRAVDLVRSRIKSGDPVSLVVSNGQDDVILNYIARG